MSFLLLAACGQSADEGDSMNGSDDSMMEDQNQDNEDMNADDAEDSMEDESDEMEDKDKEDTDSDSSMMMMTGTFMGLNGNETSGMATIEDGKLILDDFTVSEGPDLYVYLTNDMMDIENGLEVAKIALDQSMQTFDLMGEQTENYTKAVIYCKQANVIFGAADLQ
ncbi:DM13 domain-containing protein [Bacillaceae bacterium Marseille-Q3522]|nr:DM13 domain-containing protein [Bacillaceae bacterium Marseille-Q3522]